MSALTDETITECPGGVCPISHCENNEPKPVFKYWAGIKARNMHVGFTLAGMGKLEKVEYKTDYPWPGTDEWKALPENDLSAWKQLPCLEDNGFVMSESMAIVRYLAKKFGWFACDLTKFGQSEQQIQWADSLHNLLAKAHYSENRTEAMDQLFSEKGKVETMLSGLEKVLSGDVHSSPGDYSVCAGLNVLEDLESGCFDKFPKIKELYSSVMELDQVKKFVESTPHSYFKRKSD